MLEFVFLLEFILFLSEEAVDVLSVLVLFPSFLQFQGNYYPYLKYYFESNYFLSEDISFELEIEQPNNATVDEIINAKISIFFDFIE